MSDSGSVGFVFYIDFFFPLGDFNMMLWDEEREVFPTHFEFKEIIPFT